MPLVLACLLAFVMIGTGLRAVRGNGLGIPRYRSTYGPWSHRIGWLCLLAGLCLSFLLALDHELAMWLWSGR